MHLLTRQSRSAIVGAFVALMAAHAPVGAQAPGARAVLPGLDAPILMDTIGLAHPIQGSRDAIFAALESTFAELKIPIETRNPKAGLLHNLNAEVTRRLGNEPLSRYLDCGRGFSGNNADVYRISLAVSAWIEPATGEPQRLLVAVAASGRDPSGSHSAYAACTSRGALEQRVAARVQALVSAAR